MLSALVLNALVLSALVLSTLVLSRAIFHEYWVLAQIPQSYRYVV